MSNAAKQRRAETYSFISMCFEKKEKTQVAEICTAQSHAHMALIIILVSKSLYTRMGDIEDQG